MKKVIVCSVLILLAFVFPVELKAAKEFSKMELVQDSVGMKTNLISKLSEIKLIQKSTLSASEKKDLRKKVLKNKKEAPGIIGDLFLIVVGAVIAVVLIVVFLL